MGNYLSIGVSTDMATHTNIINALVNNTPIESFDIIYYGEFVVGYPLAMIIRLTGWDTNTVYLAFNFLALAGAALSLFYVTKKMVGDNAALLVIPVTFFCTTSILGLFKYGVIFNIINMYIILPFAIYFGVKWMVKRGIINFAISIFLFALFSVFHITSIYVPAAFALLLFIALMYKLVFNRRFNMLAVSIPSICFILLSMILPRLFRSTSFTSSQSAITDAINRSIDSAPVAPPILGYGTVMPPQFIGQFLSPTTFMLLCLAVCGYFRLRKRITFSLTEKWFGIIILCFIIPLSAVTFTNFGGVSVRTASDLATLIALLTACLIGVLIKVARGKWFAYTIAGVTLVGTSSTLATWLSFNKAGV